MYTASGLLVRYLKVFEKSGANSSEPTEYDSRLTPAKWVRYLTKANGTYQIRVSEQRVAYAPGKADMTVLILMTSLC